jgi:hypothetical protein
METKGYDMSTVKKKSIRSIRGERHGKNKMYISKEESFSRKLKKKQTNPINSKNIFNFISTKIPSKFIKIHSFKK